MSEITTTHLTLRPIDERDASLLFRLHQDADVARVMPRRVHRAIAESEVLLQRILAGNVATTTSGWVVTLNGESIGTVGIVRIDHETKRAAIAYEFVREYWNRGFAREAVSAVLAFGFQTLALTRIEAEIDSLNTRSSRFIEKLGFAREKTYEETIDGEQRTTLLYVRT